MDCHPTGGRHLCSHRPDSSHHGSHAPMSASGITISKHEPDRPLSRVAARQGESRHCRLWAVSRIDEGFHRVRTRGPFRAEHLAFRQHAKDRSLPWSSFGSAHSHRVEGRGDSGTDPMELRPESVKSFRIPTRNGGVWIEIRGRVTGQPLHRFSDDVQDPDGRCRGHNYCPSTCSRNGRPAGHGTHRALHPLTTHRADHQESVWRRRGCHGRWRHSPSPQR